MLHESTATLIHDKIAAQLNGYDPELYDRISLTLGKFYAYGNGQRFNPNLKKGKFNKIVEILESEPAFWDHINSETFTEKSFKSFIERKSDIGSVLERIKVVNSTHKTVRIPESEVDIRLSSYRGKIYTKEIKSEKALVSRKTRLIFTKEFVKIICSTGTRKNKNGRDYENFSIEIELIPGMLIRFPLNYVSHAVVAHIELLLFN